LYRAADAPYTSFFIAKYQKIYLLIHTIFSSNIFNNMSQLLLNKLRGLAGAAALLVVFLVVGTVDARAQGQRTASTENPYGLLAQKLGVTKCQQGTATDVQGGVATLETLSIPMKANYSSASILEKVKYEYYQLVISEVGNYHVAPEFALLTNLPKAAKIVGNESITNQQLAGLYNATKVFFGMCQ